MTMARLFVLRDADIAKRMIDYVREHAGPAAKAGKPLAVRIGLHKPRATDEQRGRIWFINEQVSQQVAPGGKHFAPEVWHEQFKRDLLPEEAAAGAQKWRYLPNGERELAIGTEDLDREEKSAYIDALQAHVATELGVELIFRDDTA